MLCISSFLRSHGHCVTSDKSQSQIVQHTRIPSIWTKLSTLYDLEALDEREDAYAYPSPDEESTSSNDGDNSTSSRSSSSGLQRPPSFIKEFALPSVLPDGPSRASSPSASAEEDDDQSVQPQHPDALDFTELIWQKRFHTASDAPSSPPEIPSLLERSWRRGTSTTGSPAPSGKRSGGRRAVKASTPQVASGTRKHSKTRQAQPTPATRKGRSEVKPDSDDEDESEEGDEEQEESGEGSQDVDDEEGEEDDDEEEEASIRSTPARSTPKTRGAGARGKVSVARGAATAARGRGARGRGRGRGAGRKRG